MEPIEQVNEDVWPVSVREALNDVIYRINRPWLIQYEDVPSARIVQADDKVVIVLPRFLSASFSARNDFSCYDAGGGNLGVTNGTVNGILPTGMTAGGVPAFTVTPSSSDTRCCLKVTASAASVSAVEILTYGAAQTDSLASGTGSGTYYLAICDFAVDAITGAITIGSGKAGIGSQTFALRRNWFSNGPTYAAKWGADI